MFRPLSVTDPTSRPRMLRSRNDGVQCYAICLDLLAAREGHNNPVVSHRLLKVGQGALAAEHKTYGFDDIRFTRIGRAIDDVSAILEANNCWHVVGAVESDAICANALEAHSTPGG